jgi:Kef-type K+ transport system membrane component KefB
LTCVLVLLLLLQVMGMLFESIKQPVINGYLVAGAIVGPGGLQLIKELVQVRTRQRDVPTL